MISSILVKTTTYDSRIHERQTACKALKTSGFIEDTHLTDIDRSRLTFLLVIQDHVR